MIDPPTRPSNVRGLRPPTPPKGRGVGLRPVRPPEGTGENGVAIAVDLGGTRARVAAIRADGTILVRVEHRTEAGAGIGAVVEHLTRLVAEVREQIGQIPIGLGIAAAGPVDHVRGLVLQAPNLGWREPVPLAAALETATGLPTLIGNDANLAALGEARFGAGRGIRNLIYITISTGIGGGIIADGQLLLGEHGASGEVGHTVIRQGGRSCHCGNQGCLEAYASGTALWERALEAMAAGRPSTLKRYGEAFAAEQIGQEAREGDVLAGELIREAGEAMGIGIRNLLHLFDPRIVVIGGGLSHLGPLLWDPLLATVADDRYAAYGERARIVAAALDGDSELVGAAVLVHEHAQGGTT